MNDREAWAARGLCRRRDPKLYSVDHVLAETGTNSGTALQAAAKERCYGCPVMAQCAQDALDFKDTGVIRAGVGLSYSTSAPTENMLKFVVEHNRNPESRKEFNEWLGVTEVVEAKCRTCGVYLKSGGEDLPFAQPVSSDPSLCQSCWLIAGLGK